jgi:pimeloyl-ACP methyl ester carboxylesterase
MVMTRDHEGAALPIIDLNGTTLHYTDTHGYGQRVLLVDRTAFAEQLSRFGHDYRVVTYDPRDADNDTLYEDAIALIEAVELGPCHVVANGAAGGVALRLIGRRPELLQSATIVSPHPDDESVLAELVGTTIPLLVVAGANEAHAPELSMRIADTAANARHVMVKRAGDSLLRDRPDVVNVLLDMHFEAV